MCIRDSLYLRGQRCLAGNGALSLCLQALERVYTGHAQLYLLLHSRNVAVKLLNAAVCLVERILHAAQRNVGVFRTQADLIGCILHLTAGVINRFLRIFLGVVLVVVEVPVRRLRGCQIALQDGNLALKRLAQTGVRLVGSQFLQRFLQFLDLLLVGRNLLGKLEIAFDVLVTYIGLFRARCV